MEPMTWDKCLHSAHNNTLLYSLIQLRVLT